MMVNLQLRTFVWLASLGRVQGLHLAVTGKQTQIWLRSNRLCHYILFSLALNRFVLLASGLGLGSSHADSMLGLQLLIDLVTGQLGEQGEQNGAATISRIILAGNLLSQNTQEKDASIKVPQNEQTFIYFFSTLCYYKEFCLNWLIDK